MRPRWLVVLALALPPAVAAAQPGKPYQPAPSKKEPYKPASSRPREAPPAPRAESPAARPGFVWVAGHWEWRNNKYEWSAGRWEKERPGKSWREGRWEKRGDEWVWNDGAWDNAPVADRPRQPPPAPREEKYDRRPGMVWVTGEWDWKNGKWEWQAGRWEKERPGKQWRTSRWEKRGDVYERVTGDWIDGGNDRPRQAPPAPREEKYDRRPGFTWVAGEWDWKNGKWEWQAGRWEKERPGKQWRTSRWEQRGDVYERTPGDWIDGNDRPRQAPPAPQAEKYDRRPGFTWVAGEWDWKNGKWEWQAGRWEKERPGKRWREARWEQRGEIYERVNGDWIDGDDRRPPERDRPRREWRLERPVIGSYWPIKGKVGSRVVIRGKNFTADTTLLWGGQLLRGARVKDDEISFVIPTGAASGMIAVKVGPRVLPVGAFEVAADYDAAAELARREAEARKAAEVAIALRNKALAADRTARRAAIQKAIDDRIASRAERREQRIAELRGKWERGFLGDAETLDELTLHAQRQADLLRLSEIAQLSGNGKAELRVEVLKSREEGRHVARMETLKANFKGGRP